MPHVFQAYHAILDEAAAALDRARQLLSAHLAAAYQPTRSCTMNKDLGVWTSDDCALVLIDYQTEMFEVIRSETSAELVELHAAC